VFYTEMQARLKQREEIEQEAMSALEAAMK
jgi:hypothetical protein